MAMAKKRDWRDNYEAQKKYNAANVRTVTFKLFRKKDADLIAILDDHPQKAVLIRAALRYYIAAGYPGMENEDTEEETE